jgi:hypothetical protein
MGRYLMSSVVRVDACAPPSRGPPVAVAAFAPAAAASCPASVAERGGGSNGLGLPRTPAVAADVVPVVIVYVAAAFAPAAAASRPAAVAGE